MSKFSEMRRAFNRELVTHAVSEAYQLREAFPLGAQLPMATMQAWLTRFRRVRDTFSQPSRLVNHFMLGADPEFIFDDGINGRIDANALHLKQGLAFGEDNNGRLCEIRPHPHRSALHVTASILATLRWLYLLCPQSGRFNWVTGAFLHRDGLGGHVHFGRKRPTRDQEVRALDQIADIILQSNVYNNGEIRARQQGDARGQRYGLPGDYRIQDHGYEYRTFPSWLDSPHLAFLMLTLSKLAVYDPPLAQSMYSRVRPQAAMENFLAYYRDTDDDARLAYALVRRMRGFPRHEGQDFRARWGIPLSQFAMPPSITVLPRSVPADEATVEELFKLFMHGEILKFSMPTPTWEPLRQPEGYDMLLAYTSTLQQKGLGELVWDLCTHKKLPIIFQGMGRNAKWAIWLSTPLAKALPSNWHVLLGDNTNYVKSVQGLSTHNVLQIGMDWREGTKRKLIREMLTCGAFPIWKVSDVKASSYEDWANGAAKHKQTFNSKILFQQGKSLI